MKLLYVIHLTDEANEEDIIHIYTTLDEAEEYYKDTIRLAEPEETDKCARCKKTFEIDYLNYYSPSDYEAEEDDEKLYCDSCYEIETSVKKLPEIEEDLCNNCGDSFDVDTLNIYEPKDDNEPTKTVCDNCLVLLVKKEK